MNKTILIGNLVRDNDLRTIQDFKVVNNVLAVKSNYKDKNGEYQTEFIEVQFTGPKADFISNYTKKGSKILVEGFLNSRKYQSEKYGCQMTAWFVKVDNVELLDYKKEEAKQESNLKQALSKIDSKEEQELKEYFGASINEDDLPF